MWLRLVVLHLQIGHVLTIIFVWCLPGKRDGETSPPNTSPDEKVYLVGTENETVPFTQTC